MSSKLNVTVLIIAQNEEENIRYCLESIVGKFTQIILVDSFSTDNTIIIAKEFESVNIYQNRFIHWAQQKNWMLENCKIENEIVLFLDSDEYIDEKFINELENILKNKKEFDAICIKPSFIFMGKRVRFAYNHPIVKRIFRKNNVSYRIEGARDYPNIKGKILKMRSVFNHYNRKSMSKWIEKQVDNAIKEAELFNLNNKSEETEVSLNHFSLNVKIKTFIRRNIWDKLPLVIRPFFYFFYRYIVLLGFLDGRAGFIYCFMHAFWYQMLIAVLIIEKRKK